MKRKKIIFLVLIVILSVCEIGVLFNPQNFNHCFFTTLCASESPLNETAESIYKIENNAFNTPACFLPKFGAAGAIFNKETQFRLKQFLPTSSYLIPGKSSVNMGSVKIFDNPSKVPNVNFKENDLKILRSSEMDFASLKFFFEDSPFDVTVKGNVKKGLEANASMIIFKKDDSKFKVSFNSDAKVEKNGKVTGGAGISFSTSN